MKPKPIRYILFDIDETLYPPSSGILPMIDARIEEYLRHRFPLPDAELKEMRQHYWRQYGTTLRGLLLEHKIDPDDYLDFVHDVPIELLVPRNAGLRQLLGRIPAAKVVFTNASQEHALRVLRALDVEQEFARIFDIRVEEFIGKPDPKVFQHVLQELHAAAEECLFIDDSPRNIRAAHGLGIRTVHVGSEHVEEAEHHIQEIDELGDILAEFEFASP